MLEQKIRERRQTFEEFVSYATTFGVEHGELGTLSLRHLQRLVSGRRSDGRPLGPVQPATARLLERIFDTNIEDLLAPPTSTDPGDELRTMLHVSRRVDQQTIDLLREQLNSIRRLDRQLGAIVAHHEVLTKTKQVESLHTYSLTDDTRKKLAALLSEFYCLAGWQALDLGRVTESWRHYDQARTAAIHSGMASYIALASAGQAFVLTDVNESAAAVELLDATRQVADRKCTPLLRSWMAAAHGETLAANNQHRDSSQAFDRATALLPSESRNLEGPYVALDEVHLARWRGHALARCGDNEAVVLLTSALDRLDRTFTRAETGLRVDMATAFARIGEKAESASHAKQAMELARRIGSVRQQNRIHASVELAS